MITSVLRQRSVRRRQRDLASHERAGAWARRRAREMQYRFARRHWRQLAVLVLGGIAISPASLLLPDGPRLFALGVWSATVVALGLFFVILTSGSAYLLSADQGEQWTRQELDPLRRHGWRVIHRVLFRQAEDIDHIAIGPGGVVVVETKWSANDWTSRRQQRWVMEAVDQVRENARITRLYVRSDIGEVPVWPVVVLWPSDDRFVEREIDGTTVLPGLQLKDWIERRPDGALDEQRVATAWGSLADHLARRDAADIKRHGSGPRSVSRYMLDLAQLPIGIVVGLVLASFLLRWVGWPVFLAPSVLVAAGALAATRARAIQRLASGVFVGDAASIVVLLVAALADLVKR